MGSIGNTIDCPNCGQEAWDELNYKTGEEWISCNNCGYNRSATIKNRDKLLTELTEEDWEYTELVNPYGAFRIKGLNSIATECGSLETESEHAELLQHLLNKEDVEFCSISRLIDGKIVEEIIIDNGPKIDSAGFTKEDR